MSESQKIRALMKQLKESDILPRGYAKQIATKLGVNTNSVYQVVAGNSVSMPIVDAIIELAEEAKEESERVKRLRALLEPNE